MPILLKRLWNYVEPGKYPDIQQNKFTLSTSSFYSKSGHNQPSTSTTDTRQSTDKADTPGSSRKRKLSGDLSARKVKTRRTSEKQHVVTKITEPQIHKQDTNQGVPVKSNDFATKNVTNEQDVSLTSMDVVDVNECSNSSW